MMTNEPMRYANFRLAIQCINLFVRDNSVPVHTEKWQGMEIQKRPEARMREVCFVAFQVPIRHESLQSLAQEIQPNLPWADDHFILERVSREPINPGTTWRNWPWSNSADKFRTEADAFNHSYAERYWPKHAGKTAGGYLDGELLEGFDQTNRLTPNHGIRYEYGDLLDVVRLLADQPLTRQAYLPVFFPEDTGARHGGRIPCSIGYHFLMRNNQLHISYQLRSCDLYRHFRDDIYLTVRLLLWVLDELRNRDQDTWTPVTPGNFIMNISSLHLFENDYRLMFPPKGSIPVTKK